MNSPIYSKAIFLTLCSFPALCVVGTTSLAAAQFYPINAEILIGELLPEYSKPVPYISAMSGDGSTIGGSFTETCCVIDCDSIDCYNSAFVWSIDDRQLLNMEAVESPGTTGRVWSPTHVVGLSDEGNLALTWSSIYAVSIQDGDEPRSLQLVGTGISDDGSVVVGASQREALLWSESSGVQAIPGVPPDSQLLPVAVAGDGETVALVDHGWTLGKSVQHLTHTIPTATSVGIWSHQQGLQVLQPALGHDRALLTSVNFDGSVVVGTSSVPHGSTRSFTATRWDEGRQTALDSIGDFDSTIATDVSADGSAIVGVARYEVRPGESGSARNLRELRARDEAVLWIRDETWLLRDFIAANYDMKDELEGWRLTSATAISNDGYTIAGQGIDPVGNTTSWVLVLNVPEPAGALLMSLPLMLLAELRQRGRVSVGI